MEAIDLYQSLLDAGMTARVNDGQLLIGPAERLTDDMRAAIKGSKPALMALLQGRGLDLELQDLIDAAMRVCDMYGDGEQARAEMHADCLATPLHLRADLLDHFTDLQELHSSFGGFHFGFHAGFHQSSGYQVETTLTTTTHESGAHHA